MLISTLSYYTTELYKEFAAYTTEKLHELGLNFGQMYFIIYVGKHPGVYPIRTDQRLKTGLGTFAALRCETCRRWFSDQRKEIRPQLPVNLNPSWETGF